MLHPQPLTESFAAKSSGGNFLDRIEQFLPKLVLAPTFVCALFFIYGFILWTGYLVIYAVAHAAELRVRRPYSIPDIVRQ